eukprot:symbB.v1.2.015826.t1/scaffold1191.1/size132917/5
MLAVVISFWAVISVELFHPHTSRIDFKNCDRCQHSFHTVFEAGVTLFQQIVAGDSWGQISIPLIDLAPWTAPFLFFIMMTVSLGMLNLILAVIVERAAEARSNDQERKLKKKEEDRARNMVDLATLCASMDSDGSGSLSLDEMLDGFNNSKEFQNLMQYMDIQRDDIETIFNVLDDDRSGEVSYYEFCKHLGSFFERDPKIVNSVVKYSMMEIRQVIKEEVVDCLQQQTKMLQDLRLSLDKLRHDSANGAPPKQKPLGELLPKEEMELPALKSLQNLLSLESAESEMKPLLSKAEALAASALLDTLALLPDAPHGAHGHPHGERRNLGRERSSSRRSEKSEKSERSDHESSPENPSNRKLQASKVLGQELEERFVLLCTRFQEHLGEAETVQDRCRKILAKLEAMKGGLVQDMLSLVERSLGTIQGSKEATDAAFDSGMTKLLEAVQQPQTAPRPYAAVMLATHNRHSLQKAVHEMERLGLSRDHPRIHFAQILGMVDNLTWALGLAGYNASKLLVFGAVHEVLPWLLRRARENRDAFGAQALELPVLVAEIRRRLSSSKRKGERDDSSSSMA